MADIQNVKTTAVQNPAPAGNGGGISAEQLQNLMAFLIGEMRKPVIDPIRELQKAREREQRDAGNKEMWTRRAHKKTICGHSRPDGSCVIAWAKQSDEKWRGYCPHCDSLFSEELDGREEFRKLYNRPRGMQENVRIMY